MSDAPQTTALITIGQAYRDEIVAQVNRTTTLLKVLNHKRGAGKNVAWVARSSGHVAENYAEGAAAANFGSDAQASAVLGWGLYRAPIHVTQLAMDTAGSNFAGPEENVGLWGENVVNSAGALADLIEDELFNGAGTGTLIAGLDVAVADTTNTYATIVRGSSAYWQPYVVDPGVATGISIGQIRTDLGTIRNTSGERPDIAVCSTAVFNKIASTFDANRRYDTLNTAGGRKIKLDAGFEGIEVDGCVFLEASKATANRIYYLNTRYVHVELLPRANQTNELADVTYADDGFGRVPLEMHFEMLAKVGAASRGQTLSTCQLVVTRPNACGARLNVSTS